MADTLMADTSEAVLSFWFQELDHADWFRRSPGVDEQVRSRFTELHARAAACELYAWRVAPEGRLAEILVLDQFSRNLYRDDARAFACDALALALAQEAVAAGADQPLTPVQRSFLYMPYMHSESLPIHDIAVQLYDQPDLEENLRFEIRHRDIIEQFGRYPHRNAVLGRHSTAEETEFLKQPGSSF